MLSLLLQVGYVGDLSGVEGCEGESTLVCEDLGSKREERSGAGSGSSKGFGRSTSGLVIEGKGTAPEVELLYRV